MAFSPPRCPIYCSMPILLPYVPSYCPMSILQLYAHPTALCPILPISIPILLPYATCSKLYHSCVFNLHDHLRQYGPTVIVTLTLTLALPQVLIVFLKEHSHKTRSVFGAKKLINRVRTLQCFYRASVQRTEAKIQVRQDSTMGRGRGGDTGHGPRDKGQGT